MTPDEWQQISENVVDRFLVRYQWQLLPRHEFVQQTIAFLREHPTVSPHFAALGVYNAALYSACSGEEGIMRWELGYQELSRMLYDQAERRYPSICQDVTQIALERTCERFERCREPRAFFGFAWQQLMNGAKSLYREERRSPVSLDKDVNEDSNPLVALLADPHPDPLSQVLSDELDQELKQLIAAYLHEHPRARKQMAALLLKYLYGLEDEIISRRLNISVKNVYVARARIAKKLRDDPKWRTFAAAIGRFQSDAEEGLG